jgi:predicted CopG family antitoxin
MHRRINICIDHEVYAKLKERGRFGESFSELISRILEETERISFENKPLEARN